MKSISRTLIAALSVAVLTLASSALAQYQATGNDGITASPKLRQALDERHRNEAIPVKPEIAKMPCSKCTDQATTRVDYTARGANKPTVLVSSHQCSGCENIITTIGTGKAATSVPIHKCANCGMANLACCNAKGSQVATTGMEKANLEVAPVK